MSKRPRYALLILIVAGTIFNVWAAFDAQSGLGDYTAKATRDVKNAAALQAAYHQLNPKATPDPSLPDLSNYEAIQREIRNEANGYYDTYSRPRANAIWEHAAQFEFGILAVGLVLWLLLPRQKSNYTQ